MTNGIPPCYESLCGSDEKYFLTVMFDSAEATLD